MAGRLEKSFDYLCWRYIALAMLDVYRENQANDSQPGAIKAMADSWGINSVLRQQIFDRVRAAWCVHADSDGKHFPYSVDYVAFLYFRYRKRTKEEIQLFNEELNGQTANLF